MTKKNPFHFLFFHNKCAALGANSLYQVPSYCKVKTSWKDKKEWLFRLAKQLFLNHGSEFTSGFCR